MKLLRIWGIVLLALSVILFLSAPSFAFQSAGRAAFYCAAGMSLLLCATVFILAYVLKKLHAEQK